MKVFLACGVCIRRGGRVHCHGMSIIHGETESGDVDINNGETGGVDTNDDSNINSASDVDARDDVRVNYSSDNNELLEVLINIIQQTTFTLYQKCLPI